MKQAEENKFDPDQIKALCEAFYNGETSPEEEQVLLRYFRSNDVSRDLSDDKEIFLQLYRPETVVIPDDLETNLIDLIDRLAENKTKKKRLQFKIWAAAASVAILLSVGLLSLNDFFREDPIAIRPAAPKDTYNDPEKAYGEAQKALTLVSLNFNKGIGRLTLIDENIDKTTKILNKVIK